MTPPSAEPTEQLLERARAGDRRALEGLLELHAEKVLSVCRRLCRDRGDAEDAAQEALLAIARGLPRFDGRSALSTWVYRVTTNACMDELRRRRRRPDPVDPPGGSADRGADSTSWADGTAWMSSDGDGDPQSALARSELRAQLNHALGELPEEFRVAVVLRDVADLDYRTISEVTGVPVGTVRSRIARGRSRLAATIEDPRGSGTESGPGASEGEEVEPGTGRGPTVVQDPPEKR